MGIPPDDYPVGQSGRIYVGTTSFDEQVGGKHVRYAEIRGDSGEDVVSLSITVVPPKGKPSIPLEHVKFGVVNGTQPQIVVAIQTPDVSPIPDGYTCQFTFQSAKRTAPK